MKSTNDAIFVEAEYITEYIKSFIKSWCSGGCFLPCRRRSCTCVTEGHRFARSSALPHYLKEWWEAG